MNNSSSACLDDHVETLRDRIEAALETYSDLGEGCPQKLKDALRYSLLAPGKRLRPVLVLLASEACAGEIEAALPAACAVEMVHCYSLIHDDLPAMDNDDLRRGRPTCHKAFDEATAILAGDALLALAFEVLAKNIHPPALAAACSAALAEAAGPCNLVGGQADDMNCTNSVNSQAMLESVHRRKTGALIQASLRLGGLIAQAPSQKLATLDQYGRYLGLAFQVIDDLLDVRSTTETIGKRTGKDSKSGKLTFPGVLGIDHSAQYAGELIEKASQTLAPFDDRAKGLISLARYVVERNR